MDYPTGITAAYLDDRNGIRIIREFDANLDMSGLPELHHGGPYVATRYGRTVEEALKADATLIPTPAYQLDGWDKISVPSDSRVGYNLFLDDERVPEDVYGRPGEVRGTIDGTVHPWNELSWHVVRNRNEFRTALMVWGLPDRVSFDYVIEEDGKGHTGADCAIDLMMMVRRAGVVYREDQVRIHSDYMNAETLIRKNLRLAPVIT